MQFVSHFSPEKFGVLFDVGHLYQAGFSLEASVGIFGDRIFDVHIHDATTRKECKKATHLPIGKGKINFPRLIAALKIVEYSGWLTLEIHGDEEEIVESKQYLEKLIEEAPINI